MNHRQRKQKRSVKNRKSFFCLFESGQNEKRNKLRKPEQVHMCRVLPNDPIPDWVAPLLNPAWRPICPSRSARVCSSLNSRLFSSAIFGPKRGPQYSGCFWVCGIVNTCLVFRSDNVMANWKLTILLRAKRHSVTWGILRRSYRSAVWKISSSGTPYFLTAAWNLHSQTKKIILIPQKNHPLRNASGRINIPVPKSAPRSFQKQFSLLFLATNFDTTSWRQKGLDHVTSPQLIRPIPEELFSFEKMTLTIAPVCKSLKKLNETRPCMQWKMEPTFGCFPSVWNFRHLSEFCWRSRARSCSSSCTGWCHHAARPRTAAPESFRPGRPRSSPAPPAPVLCCDPKRRQSGPFSNQSTHIPRNVHQHFTFKCSRPTRNWIGRSLNESTRLRPFMNKLRPSKKDCAEWKG